MASVGRYQGCSGDIRGLKDILAIRIVYDLG